MAATSSSRVDLRLVVVGDEGAGYFQVSYPGVISNCVRVTSWDRRLAVHPVQKCGQGCGGGQGVWAPAFIRIPLVHDQVFGYDRRVAERFYSQPVKALDCSQRGGSYGDDRACRGLFGVAAAGMLFADGVVAGAAAIPETIVKLLNGIPGDGDELDMHRVLLQRRRFDRKEGPGSYVQGHKLPWWVCLAASEPKIASVKCSPAVGAATDPS